MAAAGEIEAAERQKLNAHLAECPECRGLFASMAEIHAHYLPECPGSEITRDLDADLRFRTLILDRASKQGAKFSRSAKQAGSLQDNPRNRAAWTWAIVGSAVTLVAITIAVGTIRARIGVTNGAVRIQLPEITAPVISVDTRFEASELQSEVERARAEQARLHQLLVLEQRKNLELQASNTSSTAKVSDLNRQLAEAMSAEQTALTSLAALKVKQSSSDTIAAIQDSEIQRLRRQFILQSENMERERELTIAGPEVRDLISARNLHIIDVYDTNAKGKTSSAFGRIFYTEGKSLVFYAYDLNSKEAESGQYAFFVWGKRDAIPHDIKSLGKLASDDKAQKRWIFTTTDSKTLAQIDSVFITVEPVNANRKVPTGKRMLMGFLGTEPNHP